MTTLAQLQALFQRHVLEGDARFLRSIAPPSGADSANQRAGIYAQAYRLRLREALASNYPALERLLGRDAFDSVADGYVAVHRSHHASIRWYGDALSHMLERMLPDQPWLHELAEWEWAIASAFDAADATIVGAAELQRVSAEAWPSARFVFHPSMRSLRLRTNAPQLFKALSADAVLPPPGITEDTFWLIWRQKLTTRYRSMVPAEASALNTMHEGSTFEHMCTTLCDWYAPEEAAVQAARLLRTWMDEELVCKVLHDAHPRER